MDTESLMDMIRQSPLFLAHDPQDISSLLKETEINSVSAGKLIFDQGDPGNDFYLVLGGRVRIVARDEDRDEINLGVKTRGDHFGETAVITEAPRNAAARSVEDSLLLRIPRASFRKHLLATGRQQEYFQRFIQSTAIHRFLRTCTNLSSVSPRDLWDLVLQFQPLPVPAGQYVFRQGDAGDRLYLIERGRVRVVRTQEGQAEVLTFLSDGDLFGERALLSQEPRYADAVCLTDCQFYTLSAADFALATEKSPRLKAVLEDRVRSYGQTEPPVPYREVVTEAMAKPELAFAPQGPPPRTAPKGKTPRPSVLRRLRFPLIYQHDEMSCGTTCLGMISRYYGKNLSLSHLRDLAAVDTNGVSLANLAMAAEQIGYTTRAMRLEYDDLVRATLPCIIHWQDYHFVVVVRADGRHVYVADPELGLRTYGRKEFCENWRGVTLLLEPTPELGKQKEEKGSLRDFVRFVSPYKRILAEVFLASLLLNVFGLAMPLFTQNVVDNVLGHENRVMLHAMLAGMVIVLLLRLMATVARDYLIAHTSMRIDMRMLTVFYKHLLSLPLGYFKVRRVGDFIARFAENTKIREFLANTALALVLDVMMITVYVVLMAYYDVRMTLAALGLIPAAAILTLVFTPLLRRLFNDAFKSFTEAESTLIESIYGIDSVKALRAETRARWKWEDQFARSLHIEFRLSKASLWYESLGDLITNLASAVLLWYGAQKVLAGELTVGQLMAFMVLLANVIGPTERLMFVWDRLQQVLVSMERLGEVFRAKPETSQGGSDGQGMLLRNVRGEITLEKVFFRYQGGESPYILANVNLSIPSGRMVAIVGRSGSGKTTLVKLLARLHDATEGRILLDGCDIKTLNLPFLRDQVGFVLQESFLFSGSIRENISMGDPRETSERVVNAARLANAHDFIMNLPQGYDTKVGESALQLSGGQRQRIAIARALYRNPRILIFDEATNALDAESEQAIQKNMATMLQGRTAIVIAHRLSTVRGADRIVVLDSGKVVEQGSHEELLKREGLYHYLYHQQFQT